MNSKPKINYINFTIIIIQRAIGTVSINSSKRNKASKSQTLRHEFNEISQTKTQNQGRIRELGTWSRKSYLCLDGVAAAAAAAAAGESSAGFGSLSSVIPGSNKRRVDERRM